MGLHEPIGFEMNKQANLKHRQHQSGWPGTAKQCIDRTASAAALAVLSPILLGVAIAVKLDSKGPVLFKQPRHGLNNKVFDVWKFRTMTVMETGTDFQQATKDDKRITRIGSFLRRSSLDELPQLVNVLKGDMSLVGPRPHPTALNDTFAPRIDRYWDRHLVRPGLTGLAQIRGYRGPTDTHVKMLRRVQSDIDYIENWSLWKDIKIILATPIALITDKNAF